MKKLFSILTVALIAMTATATDVISYKDILVKNKTQLRKAAAKKAPAAPQRKAPYAPEETDTWTELGTGYYYDQVMYNVYSTGTQNKKYKVTVQQCNEKPGIYRFQDVFNFSSFKSTLTFSANKNRWLYVDATDPEAVSIPDYASGGEDFFDGELHIGTLDNFSGTASGTFDGKQFTFPQKSVPVWYEEYPYDGKSSWGFWACEGDYPLTLELPESAWPKDYSLSLSWKPCAVPAEFDGKQLENYWQVDVTMGADVQYLAANLFGDFYFISDEDSTIIMEDAMMVWERTEADASNVATFSVPVDFTGSPRQFYTLPIVALDANKQPVKVAHAYCCVASAQPGENWVAMNEQATFLDVFTTDAYEGSTYTEYTCSVEKDMNNPGSYRLVDPYAEMNNQSGKHTDCHHYIYAHTNEAGEAYLETSVIGADDKDWFAISSEAYFDYISQDRDPHEGDYGINTLGWVDENGEIKFNVWSLYVYTPVNDLWYWANTNSNFYIRINELMTAISTVSAKTAEKSSVSFNLAGQRVGANYKGIVIKDGKKILQ
ncbi:MAG: hypothetical protein HUK02_08870 [Bacteroidaceae bacterium]|nr:hypothetical protein [Bacteroidaceae bacterium]